MKACILIHLLLLVGCCMDPKNVKVVAVGGCDSNGQCKATLENGDVVNANKPVVGQTIRMCANDLKCIR